MGCLGTLLQYTYAVKYRRGGTAGLESPAKDTSPKARKTHYNHNKVAAISHRA